MQSKRLISIAKVECNGLSLISISAHFVNHATTPPQTCYLIVSIDCGRWPCLRANQLHQLPFLCGCLYMLWFSLSRLDSLNDVELALKVNGSSQQSRRSTTVMTSVSVYQSPGVGFLQDY